MVPMIGFHTAKIKKVGVKPTFLVKYVYKPY
jgi:hypothetical protein